MGRAVGNAFEGMAVQYLQAQGAEILERNYAALGAEIDIICRLDGTLVFVEVKARLSPGGPAPGEEITPAKQRNICRAAAAYLHGHGGFDQMCRFDAILIRDGEIEWVQSAFDYQAGSFRRK